MINTTTQEKVLPDSKLNNFLLTLFTNTERTFLLVGVIFGFLFLFIMPPFQVPDENRHFYRAYQVSDGGIIAQREGNISGGLLPKSLLTTYDTISADVPHNPENKINFQDVTKMLSLPLNRDDKTFIDFSGSAIYTPVPYLPATLGITLGKIFGSSPLVLMYLGRITNLLVALWLTYLAIKITPVCKWVFFVLALTPMAIHQMASLSADSFTNAISMLFVAWVFQFVFDKNRNPNNKDLVILLALSLGLTLAKQAYLPLLLLYFLIPYKKIGSIKKYLGVGAGMLFANLLALAVWSSLALGVFALKAEGTTVSPGDRLRGILTNPFNFIQIVLNEYSVKWFWYFEEFIGDLGWLDTKLPILFQLLFGAMLIFVALTSANPQIGINLVTKLKLFGIFGLGILSLSILAYISWAPLNQVVDLQLQGRYFIPFMPLFFILFYNQRYRRNTSNYRYGMTLVFFLFLSLSLTLWIILNRYYGNAPS